MIPTIDKFIEDFKYQYIHPSGFISNEVCSNTPKFLEINYKQLIKHSNLIKNTREYDSKLI